MSTTKALAYFRDDCKTRIVADAGPEGLGAVLLQFRGEVSSTVSYTSRNLTEVERLRQRKRHWLLSGHARDSTFMFMAASLNWRLTTNPCNISSGNPAS